jgi:hypothetical protein
VRICTQNWGTLAALIYINFIGIRNIETLDWYKLPCLNLSNLYFNMVGAKKRYCMWNYKCYHARLLSDKTYGVLLISLLLNQLNFNFNPAQIYLSTNWRSKKISNDLQADSKILIRLLTSVWSSQLQHKVIFSCITPLLVIQLCLNQTQPCTMLKGQVILEPYDEHQTITPKWQNIPQKCMS